MSVARYHRDHDQDPRSPIVIAHRGASGYRPEHTLEAYRLAIEQGADFIEPDLVATSDGVLIARHENEISSTTDVAAHPAFAGRRTTKTVDGRPVSGWFSEDFSLAEIKMLRARERIPEVRPDNARFDGMYSVPTFAEVLQLARCESRDGRVVGVYPETKYPTYFASEGRHLDGRPIALSLGARLIQTLVTEGFTDPHRVYIQSFEIANLIELKHALMPAAGVDLPLVQLYDDLDSATPYDIGYHVRTGADLAAVYPGLAAVVAGGLNAATRYRALASEPALHWIKANYATVIAPCKDNLLPRATHDRWHDRGDDGDPASVMRDGAHPMLAAASRAGLLVHPYTLRAEDARHAGRAAGASHAVITEAMQLYGLGVQGLFFDQPDLGVAARARLPGRGRHPDTPHAAPDDVRD